MRFADVQDRIKTGDVMLFRPPTVPRPGRLLGWFLSWFIGLRTHSLYSHAGAILRIKVNGHTIVSIIEATMFNRVRVIPLIECLGECAAEGYAVDWFSIVDHKVDREKMADYFASRWHKRYAFSQLFWAYSWPGKLLRKLGIGPATMPTDLDYCSELVVAAAHHAGWVPPEGDITDRPADQMPPGLLALANFIHREGTVKP